MSNRFQVNLRGIIEILSNHLYSRPDVFVRELLQNGVDAITARRQIEPDHVGDITFAVTQSGAAPTLEVTDNGVGLTEDEVHRFLAVIGSTSKRDDQGQRTGDFLGQFGIGLLSCFVVSDEIVVVTRSARPGFPAVEWRGQGDGTYSVRTLDIEIAPGTQVYLRCRAGSESLFTPAKLAELASHYGGLLPIPIRIANGAQVQIVNAEPPPWRRSFPNEPARTAALLDFGEAALGATFMDAIPLKTQAGGIDGVAFVLPHPANLNSRRAHRVYLRNMLLSEEADNLLPDWAFFVKAVVNANDLRPTASREGFYEDERLEAARVELGNALRGYLVWITEHDPKRFEYFTRVHHLAIKALAAEDEDCFRLFADWLSFETSQGRQTVRMLRDQHITVNYVTDVSEFLQMEKIAKAQGLLLINAGYAYDAEICARLSEVAPEVEFRLLTSEALSREFESLDLAEQDQMHELLEIAQETLRPLKCRPEARKFKPTDLPALFSAGEDARFFRSLERSKETSNALFQNVLGGLAGVRGPEPTTELVLNFSNPLIRRMATLDQPRALAHAVRLLYVQALLLAHQPLSSRELGLLNGGLSGLLEAIAGS
jgi:molecular chaperone HtpG